VNAARKNAAMEAPPIARVSVRLTEHLIEVITDGVKIGEKKLLGIRDLAAREGTVT
jgi:hypothetical protein